jgi:REP element-mobilizing transposase RayT
MRLVQVAIFLHCVWATWDRLSLLTPATERIAYRAIEGKCAELGVEVLAIGGVEDHLHVLLQLPATESIAHVMKEIKGSSGHLIAHKVAPDGFFRWQGAYAVFSVSIAHLEMVRNYILHQKEHHAAATLVSSWELNLDDDES